MRFLLALGLVVIVLSSSSAQENVIELRNADVLSIIASKVPIETIIERIGTSRCYFDTFPPVISELRYRGVPEEILIAMVSAPIGRATKTANTTPEAARKSSATPPTMEKSKPGTGATDTIPASSA